jgi:hypothetical protein
LLITSGNPHPPTLPAIENRIAPIDTAQVTYMPIYSDDSSAVYCRFDSGSVGAGKAPPRGPSVLAAVAPPIGDQAEELASEADRSGTPAESYLKLLGNGAGGGRAGLELGVALGQEGMFRATVFDVRGRRVARVLDRPLVAGRHVITWDGRDGSGRRTASGVYFLRVNGPAFQRTAKLVITR